jgi:predicted phosphate transport protein (TIGR00153 family)
MFGWIRIIMPREDRFFDLFERQSVKLVDCSKALAELVSGKNVATASASIREIENAADEVTRDVLLAVRRSFVTPFDRSAIKGLISSMDDAIDEMWQAAKAVILYRISDFDPQVKQVAQLAVEAAVLVAQGIPLMRKIGRNGSRLHELTERIVHLEGRADELYQQGVAALFEAHGERPMQFVIGREIYIHIERVMDRLEDVADEIQGIAIDHA